MDNFYLVRKDVDIRPLLEELDRKPELWLHNTSRQDKVNVQRETNTIFLRSVKKPFPPGITNGNDAHESRRTKISKEFPVVLGWLEALADEMECKLCRATIVKLLPKGRVYRHIDMGEYYKKRERYHLVLRSTLGSPLICDDEEVRMREGELWWFDNKKPHEAFNESDEDRIHVIFDLQPRPASL